MPPKVLVNPLLPVPDVVATDPKPPPLFLVVGKVRLLDSFLAGLGLWFGCAVLGVAERHVGVPLFAPPMMASGIIFSFGLTPPHPKGFISGTFCSATFSLLVYACIRGVTPADDDPSVVAMGAAAGAMVFWYKLSATVFPPAVVLAGSLGSTAAVSHDLTKTVMETAWYLCFPWLVGHAFIYACALFFSRVRAMARRKLAKARMSSLGDLSDHSLFEVFKTFDTSGDGQLDANELKVALRMALRMELSIEDCVQLVNAADKNGSATCDFDEFKAICRSEI